MPIVLESQTWRASPDWAVKAGYTVEQCWDANRVLINLLHEMKAKTGVDAVVGASVGPRDDGYVVPEPRQTREEAEAYHSQQVAVIAECKPDFVLAKTFNYVEEIVGLIRACKKHGLPIVQSMTVEVDGRLPSGQTLKECIEQVDKETDNYVSYFAINCAHPNHLIKTFEEGQGQPWLARIRQVECNSADCSHKELNEKTELDIGNPEDFGRLNVVLRTLNPALVVNGGCCGTDYRHIEQVLIACTKQ